MDEAFLMAALQASGEGNGLVSIKVIRNRVTGEHATYGFINFVSDHNALLAMHRLNGKIMPNTNPPIKYKLNHNSTRLAPGERDFSIWVGDLSPDVDDLELYKFFSARYQSVRTCKVVLDATGYSKGYGFIRFLEEREQQGALTNMMGASGLGTKPIKVSMAVPKGPRGAGADPSGGHAPMSTSAAADPNADYSQYWQNQYGQYWSQYAAWNQYYEQQQQQSSYYGQAAGGGSRGAAPPSSAPPKDSGSTGDGPQDRGRRASRDGDTDASSDADESDIFHGDDAVLVDHSPKMDYDKANNKYIKKSEELWDALEASFWWQDRPVGSANDGNSI